MNALEKDSYLQISARKEVAKLNSWENRFKDLNKYINDQLALKEKQILLMINLHFYPYIKNLELL